MIIFRRRRKRRVGRASGRRRKRAATARSGISWFRSSPAQKTVSSWTSTRPRWASHPFHSRISNARIIIVIITFPLSLRRRSKRKAFQSWSGCTAAASRPAPAAPRSTALSFCSTTTSSWSPSTTELECSVRFFFGARFKKNATLELSVYCQGEENPKQKKID